MFHKREIEGKILWTDFCNPVDLVSIMNFVKDNNLKEYSISVERFRPESDWFLVIIKTI